MTRDIHGRSHLPKGSAGGVGGRFANNPGAGANNLPPLSPDTSLSAREKCVKLAKRREIDLLWRSANIEVAVTFPDTRDVFNGITPIRINESGVRIINNLKHAWQFLFDNTQWPVDWAYLSEYNRLVGDGINPNPGMMRTSGVTIGGTDYIPEIPDRDLVRQNIQSDLSQNDPKERAMALFCDISRGQWFENGNKRTAVMAANQSLIHDGAGLFRLPPESMDDVFRGMLTDFYETGDRTAISDWMRKNAIGSPDDGLTEAERR